MSNSENTPQKKLRPTKTANSDAGLKYEISVATLVAATLSNNEQIENYHVFTNLKEAHPFDDVVVKVVFKSEDAPYVFAMQLKHVGKGETLDVEKYLKGYNKILDAGGFKTIGNISVANIHFCYFCINKVQKADHYTLHEHNPPGGSWRSTLVFPNCHKLLYRKPINETHKDFLDNFPLYLYQPDNNKIKENIKTLCKMTEVSGILNYVDRFFEKGELWKRGLCKEVFETELLRIRLSDRMIPPTDIIQHPESQAEIWNKLTLEHNATIVEAEANIEKSLYGCLAQTLNRLLSNVADWSTCKRITLDSNIISKFKDFFKVNQEDRVRHWIDPPATLKSLVIELWKCGELPLILGGDDDLYVLKEFAHLNKSYILITKNAASKRAECDRYRLRVFTHVSDIKCLDVRNALLKTISISLHGREPITLYSLINRHEELSRTLSCSHIVHLMKPRIAYLSQKCLDGDHNMVFLIEDPTSTAEYSIDSINMVGGNIAIRCHSEEVNKYRRQIEQNPKLQNYEIYHCTTSSESENFTLVEGNKFLLRNFFVDQDGEGVYVLEKNPVPIVGPSLKSVQQTYIPRFLCSAKASRSLFDSQTKGICFFSGDISNLEEDIRTQLVDAPEDTVFDNENVFIKVKDEDVDRYWRKASNLKCPLLHIRVEGTDMHLCKCKKWVGLSDHISYNGRKISEGDFLADITDGITILTGVPGIGKSYLLQSIFRNHGTEKYILFYNLVDYGRFLANEKLVPTNISLDFLLDRSKNKRYKEFLSALFKRKDRVLVLLDSFDEVLPIHKESVLHFIRNLATSKVQIIIASRIIANYILISNFEVRIFKIDYLGMGERKEYIKNCKLNDDIITAFPDEFSQNPLYLNLLKTISENNVDLKNFSKLSLFQNVVNIKMEQYFQRYFSNEHIPNKELYLQPVRELHFQLALMRILGVDIVKELLQLESKNELTNELKLGIVLSIDERGYPLFVHETFAEYLTADWIIRNQTKKSAMHIYLEMLQQGKLYVLDILCEHLAIHKAVLSQNVEQITVLARDCKHLERTDALGRMAIHVAAAHQPNALWSAIDIIICSMREFKVNLTRPDALMQWNWMQHLYQPNVIEFMLDNTISTPVWEAYVNCIAQKSKVGSKLCINLFSDYEITKMYKVAIRRDSIGMIRDLLFIEDVRYNGVSLASHVNTLHLRNIRKLTALHVGCIYGNVKIVKKIVKKTEQINTTDSFGCTPLHYSVMNSSELYTDMTKMLLENGSKVDIKNEYGKTAINIAVCSGNLHVTKLLLQEAACIGSARKDILKLLFLAVHAVVDAKSITKGLVHASTKKKLEIVRLLLEKGVDVNGKNTDGETPLTFASKRSNLDIVKILLEKGASVNGATSYGKTPLMFASETGNSDIVKILLKKGANVNDATPFGNTSLMFASERGNLDIIKILLKDGANVNAATTDGNTPLMFASGTGNLDILKILLQKGANIDSTALYGKTPLMLASERGNLDIVKMLSENGANINSATSYGKTPLMFASEGDNLDIVKILLKKGANVNDATTDGSTPLMFASKWDNLDIVKILLENGASVNAARTDGKTSLMFASAVGNLDMAKILLKEGANVYATTTDGNTPLMFASESDNLDIVNILLEKGANVSSPTTDSKTPLTSGHKEDDTGAAETTLPLHLTTAEPTSPKYRISLPQWLQEMSKDEK